MSKFMTQEEFLQTHGDVCPNKHCPGRDEPSISGGFVAIDGGYARQAMSCAWCGARWAVWYELEGYSIDYIGDNDEA